MFHTRYLPFCQIIFRSRASIPSVLSVCRTQEAPSHSRLLCVPLERHGDTGIETDDDSDCDGTKHHGPERRRADNTDHGLETTGNQEKTMDTRKMHATTEPKTRTSPTEENTLQHITQPALGDRPTNPTPHQPTQTRTRTSEDTTSTKCSMTNSFFIVLLLLFHLVYACFCLGVCVVQLVYVASSHLCTFGLGSVVTFCVFCPLWFESSTILCVVVVFRVLVVLFVALFELLVGR